MTPAPTLDLEQFQKLVRHLWAERAPDTRIFVGAIPSTANKLRAEQLMAAGEKKLPPECRANWYAFGPGEGDQLVQMIERENQRRNIMLKMARFQRDATSANLSTVAAAHHAWVDIDCGPDKIDFVLEQLAALGAWRPTAAVRSGGGVHAYWLLSGDAAEAASPARLKLVEQIIQQLVRVFAGDPGPATLAGGLRVPGTWNHNRDAPAEIVWLEDGRKIDADQLYKWLDNAGPVLIKVPLKDGGFEWRATTEAERAAIRVHEKAAGELPDTGKARSPEEWQQVKDALSIEGSGNKFGGRNRALALWAGKVFTMGGTVEAAIQSAKAAGCTLSDHEIKQTCESVKRTRQRADPEAMIFDTNAEKRAHEKRIGVQHSAASQSGPSGVSAAVGKAEPHNGRRDGQDIRQAEHSDSDAAADAGAAGHVGDPEPVTGSTHQADTITIAARGNAIGVVEVLREDTGHQSLAVADTAVADLGGDRHGETGQLGQDSDREGAADGQDPVDTGNDGSDRERTPAAGAGSDDRPGESILRDERRATGTESLIASAFGPAADDAGGGDQDPPDDEDDDTPEPPIDPTDPIQSLRAKIAWYKARSKGKTGFPYAQQLSLVFSAFKKWMQIAGQELLYHKQQFYLFTTKDAYWTQIEDAFVGRLVSDFWEYIEGRKPQQAMIGEYIALLQREYAVQDPEWGRGLRRNRQLIVTGNGQVIEVLSGQIVQANPNDRLNHQHKIDTEYQPGATCPDFDSAIEKMFSHINPTDRAAYVQIVWEWMATALLKGARPRSTQKAAVFHGDARTGKTTIIQALTKIIGRSRVSSDSIAGLTGNHAGMSLISMSAWLVDEVAIGSKMAEDWFKKIITNSPVTINIKNKPHYHGTLNLMVGIATNTLPKFNDSTLGIQDRVIFIPCQTRFLDAVKLQAAQQQITQYAAINGVQMPADGGATWIGDQIGIFVQPEIPDLDLKITAERSGILNKMMQAARTLMSRGKFDIPAELDKHADEIREQQNPMLACVRDCFDRTALTYGVRIDAFAWTLKGYVWGRAGGGMHGAMKIQRDELAEFTATVMSEFPEVRVKKVAGERYLTGIKLSKDGKDIAAKGWQVDHGGAQMTCPQNSIAQFDADLAARAASVVTPLKAAAP